MPRIISAYQIVDHGIEHEQYFQGCGVSYTEYEDCYTGMRVTLWEALDDALDIMATEGKYEYDSNPDLKAEIQGNLTEAENKVTVYKNTVLSNQVKLAENDGSEKEINKVLKKVKQARSFAAINGNDDEVAAYDLTIASLNSQKVQNKAEDIVNEVAVKGTLGTNDSTSKLKTLNLQIADADTETPVTINGKRFASEQT